VFLLYGFSLSLLCIAVFHYFTVHIKGHGNIVIMIYEFRPSTKLTFIASFRDGHISVLELKTTAKIRAHRS